MRESVRVVVLGTGRMGCAILRLVLRKPGLALAGAFARRRARAGLDVSALLGLDAPVGVAVESDLRLLLRRARADVAIPATCSRLADAEGEIATCLESGVHVVSIAEELAWPAALSPAWAARMDRLANEPPPCARGRLRGRARPARSLKAQPLRVLTPLSDAGLSPTWASFPRGDWTEDPLSDPEDPLVRLTP